MSTTVTATVTATIAVQDVSTGGSLAANDALAYTETATLYSGGANPVAVGAEWSGVVTLVAGTPQTLDLQSLAGPRASTITLTSATLFYVYNTGASVVTVGGAGSNPWVPGWSSTANTIDLQPGSRWLIEGNGAAWPVSGSACNLQLSSGGSAGSCRVVILGN